MPRAVVWTIEKHDEGENEYIVVYEVGDDPSEHRYFIGELKYRQARNYIKSVMRNRGLIYHVYIVDEKGNKSRFDA